MAITLDRNELAYLRALTEVDPDGEYWTTTYATGFNPGAHGADVFGNSLDGRFSVAKRLKSRGLVDSDGAMRSATTGVALTNKGRRALEEADA